MHNPLIIECPIMMGTEIDFCEYHTENRNK